MNINSLYTAKNLFADLHPLGFNPADPLPPTLQSQHFQVVHPNEKAIKPGTDFDKQVTTVENTSIKLKADNSLKICLQEDWNFPEISFSVKELREYLEHNLKAEGWLIGGAANPAGLPFNDIDLGFYILYPNYPLIDKLILEFIRSKMIEKRATHPGYFPIDQDWAIYKIYYSGRSIFKDHAGAFYGLQGLQIKIFEAPHFHCVSPADGAQVSPSRRILRFATGKGFALTDQEFRDALSACFNKVYDVMQVAGHRDLIFRLNCK
jgi:hypothetical protein